ncbi:MAG: hypothetical protein D6731_18960 [Planctomycetota bacterium]|nr:MAG: hypothetical protein D6731_18960 [Planctomycetota bacterium]
MPAAASSAGPDELNAVLGHPLLLFLGALTLAWLASRVVHEQVRRLRVERPDDVGGLRGFGWTTLFSALAFWAVLCLCLLGIVHSMGLAVVERFLEAAFDLILRGLLAAAILAAAAVFGDVAVALPSDAGEEERARARKERQAVHLVGGVLAVGAATGLSLGTWLLLGVLAVPCFVLLKSPKARRRVAVALDDVAAGLRLRDQLRPGQEVGEGPERLRVVGKVGWLKTWVVREGRRVLLGNHELFRRVDGAPSGEAGRSGEEEAPGKEVADRPDAEDEPGAGAERDGSSA